MSISLKELAHRYRVTDGTNFKLSDFKPTDTWKLKDKEHAQDLLAENLKELSELQAKLYAQKTWSLLLIFQAMDAAGKDSIIKHVMSGVDPQGCEVHSFKAPSSEELDHDYLWRCQRRLPLRGLIGIFNRSYYEEALVVRVHPEILKSQNLPPSRITKHVWKERLHDMAGFERYLDRNGIIVRKFYLNVSRDEQKKRFLERLDRPEKHWKFSAADVLERRHWSQYRKAYDEAIRHTATEQAPWHIIPADHKWFTRLAVASVIVETLQSLKLQFPKLKPEDRRNLAEVKSVLERER